MLLSGPYVMYISENLAFDNSLGKDQVDIGAIVARAQHREANGAQLPMTGALQEADRMSFSSILLSSREPSAGKVESRPTYHAAEL